MSTTLARKSAEKGLLTAAGWTLRRGLIWLLGPLLAGVAGTNLLTAVAYGVVIQARTLSRGLPEQAYKVETSRNIGWAAGAFVGMSAGALLGSLVPVLGTLVLSLILGGVGGLLGALVGRVFGWMVHGRPKRR